MPVKVQEKKYQRKILISGSRPGCFQFDCVTLRSYTTIMKIATTLRSLFTIVPVFIFLTNSFSQDCTVAKDSLKGVYTGDCKNGKAHGKGKAVGADTYEGDFRSGLPDGEGTYTWSNGNVFRGHFAKGLLDGKGVFMYKRKNAGDSVLEGFWKKDTYVGKFESPYAIAYKSSLVNELEVTYKRDNYNQLTINVTSTIGGGASVSGGALVRMKVDDIELYSGSYGRMQFNEVSSKKTQTVVTGISFPIHMKVVMGRESFEIELREAGSYIADVVINQ
jgi:hypothetical protein